MSKPKYKTRIMKAMKAMNTYRKEFDLAIGVLANLQEQYDELNARYMEAGMPYFENTQAGKKKSPIVTTLESLRKDILAYQTALGLTPQGAKRLDTQQADTGGTGFESMLAELERDAD